jgi:hypothetical protein
MRGGRQSLALRLILALTRYRTFLDAVHEQSPRDQPWAEAYPETCYRA